MRQPVVFKAGDDVDVRVKYQLSRRRLIVDADINTTRAGGFSYRARDGGEFGKKRPRLGIRHVQYGARVALGEEECVSRVYGACVQKRQHFVILVYFMSGYVTLDYFAKNTVVHHRIVQRAGETRNGARPRNEWYNISTMHDCTPYPPISVEAEKRLLKYPPLLRTLLWNRGITNEEEADIFLYPDYERDIRDPFLILNMERAVDRILAGIVKKERIVVYGDYDCDGIPGSVIMHDFFKKIRYENFKNYIPHRHKEGYGLHVSAIDEFAREGVSLIITVDLGITNREQVAHAQSLGIDVIITDHHLPEGDIPPAYAVINSKQSADTYHDNMLCGAGVAWKLVQAILKKESFGIAPGWEKWLLDMAGISTIADMVPLRKENRALAHFGLKVLRKSPRVGLQKLLQKAGVNQKYMTEGDIGFMIAPRINAASRMATPMDAFSLLSAEDEARADEYALHLHNLNNNRKLSVARIMKEAHAMCEARSLREVIVIGNPKWHVGIAGIIAGNIVEKHRRPSFVWGRDDNGLIKGSCRSDGSVNIVDLMAQVPEFVFLAMGGHKEAGGFTVSHEHIHTLEDELVSAYARVEKTEPERTLFVDATLSLSDVSWALYDNVALLAPFGMANPNPVFLFQDVVVKQVDHFGKERNHLKLSFEGSRVSAIGFFMDADAWGAPIAPGERVHLAATLEKSMFRGTPELRLRITTVFRD